MKKIRYKENLVFLLLFFVGFLNAQTKSQSIETLSKENAISIGEAEAYYNFKKNLVISEAGAAQAFVANNALASCGPSSSNTQNIGFELGNNSNWIIQRGFLINALTDSMVNISPATSTQSILTTGNDPVTGFSYNSPFAGNHVMKLNDANINSEATFMSTKFVVSSSTNILKTAFSFVHSTAGHECSGNPYFRIQLFSCNRTNLIKEYLFIPEYGICTGYNASFFNPPVNAPNGYTATDWKKICFDLRNYIGEEVELNVIVADCIYNGHYGYTYFDAEFGALPTSYSIANTFFINSAVNTYSAGVSNQCFNQGSVLQCPGSSGISYQLSNGSFSLTPANTITLSQGGVFVIKETAVAGCDFHRELNINVKPTVNIVAPSLTVCPNSAAIYTISGAKTYTVKVNNTYYNPYGSSGILPIPCTIQLTQNPSTITVIGSGGNNNCLDSTSIVMQVLPVPTLSVIYTPTVCVGNTTMSVSGAVSYTWNSSVVSPTYNASVSNVTYISVAGTNSVGCKASSTFSVLGMFGSGITLSNYSNIICAGDSALLSVNGASSYTWSNGFTGCCQYLKPTIASPVYTVAASGMCNPTTTLSIPFTVQASPAPNSFTVNFPSPVCSNQSFTVQGVGANFYMKWGPTGQYNNNVTAYVTNANPTFTAIALGSNGCTTTSVITMPLLPTPTLGISGSTAICSGQSASLSALGASSYTWDSFVAANTYTTSTALNNFNVALTGINSAGCGTTTSFPILVEKPGIIASPNATSVCLGANTLTLSATSLGSGGTYSWSTGAITQSIVVTPTITTTYTVMINSPICGVSIYSTTINVIQSTAPILLYTLTPVCVNKVNTITVSGANSYTIASTSGSSNTNTFTFTPTNTLFSYAINITGTFTNGCSTNTLLIVPVNSTPNIGVFSTPSNTVCKTSTVNLTASGAAISYTWSTSTTGNVTTITPSVNATYTVIGTAANGCTNSAVSPLIVGLNSPTITVTPASPTVCLNSPFTLTASVVGGSGFSWNGTTTGATYTSSVNTPTVFSVTSSTPFCSTTKTIAINTHSPAAFSLTSPVCAGNLNVITYSATPPGGTLFINSIATNTIYSNVTSTYNISYMYLDPLNCMLSTSTVVTVNQKPCIKLVANTYTTCIGNQVTFTGTPAGGFYSSNITGNSLVLPAAGSYTASYTYSDANNCSSTICTEVTASICTDIKSNDLKLINIYPNPSHNAVTIDNPAGGEMILKIYDINGRLLDDKELENTINVIDISRYTNGLYIFYLESNTNRRFVKIIKE